MPNYPIFDFCQFIFPLFNKTDTKEQMRKIFFLFVQSDKSAVLFICYLR